MNYLDKKKILCLIGTLFYVYYVLKNYLPFDYYNVFFGVRYNGYILFYAATLYLFGIVILYGFGNTQSYVNGYGILHLLRSKKRSDIIKRVVQNQMINLAQIIISMSILFIAAALFHGEKTSSFSIKEFAIYAFLFYLVSLSLVLWQALFEIMFDSRIAILIVMSIIGLHLYIGDFLYLHKGNSYLYLLVYSNLALVARSQSLTLSKGMISIIVGIICIIQVVLMNIAFKKKDILNSKGE